MSGTNRLFLGCLSILFVACGGGTTPSNDDLVGRWAAQTTVDDLVFATGRDVRLDEVFELTANGTMRGDFAGWDSVSRCVVTYRLTGTWAAPTAGTLDAQWTSIRVAVAGCNDDAQNQAEAEVDAAEREIWDNELDGTWVVAGGMLTIEATGGSISYSRVESPLVARWTGSSIVSDFTFAEDRDVEVSEVFWVNDDGSLAGYFTGSDATSGCTIDYRMAGTWVVTGTDTFDAQWTSISAETFGCTNDTLNSDPTEVVAEEGDIWDDELDGTWTIEGNMLSIMNTVGGTIEYTRAL